MRLNGKPPLMEHKLSCYYTIDFSQLLVKFCLFRYVHPFDVLHMAEPGELSFGKMAGVSFFSRTMASDSVISPCRYAAISL